MTIGLFYSGWLSPVGTLDEAGRAASRLLPTADFMTLVLGVYAVVFVFLSVLGFKKRRR